LEATLHDGKKSERRRESGVLQDLANTFEIRCTASDAVGDRHLEPLLES
jgi:hypothetical protein